MRRTVKRLHKIFAGREHFKEDRIFVADAGEVNHILRVLRLRKGENVLVNDLSGREYLASFAGVENGRAVFHSLEERPVGSEPSLRITLFQGIPKSDKMETIVQKATELGASGIAAFLASRSVKRPSDGEKYVKRLERIALESAKQSNRGLIPAVSGILSYEDALQRAKESDAAFLLYENEKDFKIRDCLQECKHVPSLGFFVGPEGGFSEEEVLLAKEQGIRPVGLGERILRTETAGIAALSAILYETGNL